MHALVCFAVEQEAGPFRKAHGKNPRVSILITGIGQRNARKSVREVLADVSPSVALSCGFAGGLDPELRSGSVLFTADAPRLREDLAAAGARSAKFHCAPRIASTTVEKRELRRITGADAVEMESEAIQSVCREAGIPCATVRVILDEAGEDLPLDFNKLSNEDMNLDYAKLAMTLAKSPAKIAALLRLKKQARFAAQRLADALGKVRGLT